MIRKGFIGKQSLATLALIAGGLIASPALAGATFHLGGSAATGLDPVQLHEGTAFTLDQVAGGATTLSPVDLIFAVPDYGSTVAPTLGTAMLDGTTAVTLNTTLDASWLSGASDEGLWSSGDIYSFLGLKGDKSNSITNFDGALSLAGLGTAGLKGYEVYVIEAETVMGGKDTLATANDVLANGTFIVAYSEDAKGNAIDTAFTEAGLVNGTSVVPEPFAWAMMLIGFAGIGGALRHRARGIV
jgi:hypothetical protein